MARDLGIGKSSLAEVIKEKRRLSRKNIERLIGALELSPTQELALRNEGNSKFEGHKKVSEKLRLEEAQFSTISDWLSLALLNLAKTGDCKSSPTYLAKRFNVTREEIVKSINALQVLGLINKKDSFLIRTSKQLNIETGLPSVAIKKFHSSLLRKSEEALFNLPIDERYFASITMAANSEKFEAGKKIIQEMEKKLEDLLEGEDPDKVIVFGCQYYPLS